MTSLVDAALAVEGLTASAPTLDQYLDAIITCASDRADPKKCAIARLQSSCARRACKALLEQDIEHPILLAPYSATAPRYGAMGDLVAIARELGALRPITTPLTASHLVIIEGPEHVACVIGVDGSRVCSIDGGQRVTADDIASGRVDPASRIGDEAILRRERVYVGGHAPTLDGRPISFVIDVDAAAAAWAQRAA